jgi:glycosyltransferase involved in cell wall biosynthesis
LSSGVSWRMRLGIDASNIRSGGGVVHLVHMLAAADPSAHGFEAVVVWAPRNTLARLEDRPWLLKRHEFALERSYPLRAWWQGTRLGRLARVERCELLFVPGGAFVTHFRPVVTMSRNLLPFEWRELWRYGCSMMTLRLLLLRRSQSRSFRNASGTIFLTRYAQNTVRAVTGQLPGESNIIPHGVDERFFQTERVQRSIEQCSAAAPLRIVYVSIVDVYKHQWHVATAAAQLRTEGLPVSLTLIGSAYGPALRRLRKTMRRFDLRAEFLHYAGPVAHDDLPAHYAGADLCVFASSCENMPNILLEAMASALPIACSNKGSMPEVLGDAGVYFDPEDPVSIAQALRQLIASPRLRLQRACAARERARQFSWARCARETFAFLQKVAVKQSLPAPASST